MGLIKPHERCFNGEPLVHAEGKCVGHGLNGVVSAIGVSREIRFTHAANDGTTPSAVGDSARERQKNQVAPGNENTLRLRVYGEKGGLEWAQEDPNYLWHTPFGEPKRLLTRGGAGSGAAAGRVSRIPPGHPESTAARRRGVPVLKYAQMLGRLMNDIV